MFRRSHGFTLVEVLVATALFSGSLMAVVQLIALVTRSQIAARDVSQASALASQKLHELIVEDIAALAVSPADAWRTAVDGHVEYLDASGAVLGTGAAPPGAAIFVRRWSVRPLDGDPSGGLVVQVSTGRLRRIGAGSIADASPSEVARTVGIRTKRAP